MTLRTPRRLTRLAPRSAATARGDGPFKIMASPERDGLAAASGPPTPATTVARRRARGARAAGGIVFAPLGSPKIQDSSSGVRSIGVSFQRKGVVQTLPLAGGPGGMGLRTLTALPCIVGVVRDSWTQGCFSVYPLRKSWAIRASYTPLMRSCPEGRHIIHLSQNWAAALDSGLVGSSADIAKQVGLTPGRVRQILWLAALEPGVADFLAALEGKRALRGYPEKRIRPMLALSGLEQIEAFEGEFGVRLGS